MQAPVGPVFAAHNLLVAAPALGLATGIIAFLQGSHDLAHLIWIAGIVPVLGALAITISRGLASGDFGLDIIAGLAMAGAIAAGEPLAGVVVAMMFAGGQALEAYAQGRAAGEMTALMGRIARTAQVYRGTGLETVAIDDIRPGDRLMIRSGEVLPVDGVLASTAAAIDESALTGEAMPVTRQLGVEILSGVTNAGPPFDICALRPARDSTYAGIVRLVESARHSKAPMSRMADRYALGFLAATIALSGGAWLATGDPLRALAVLVIATPCPLILAVPVAIVAGMSRCAKRGVLVKSARALEAMARIRTLLVDKTGTMTDGRAKLVAIELPAGENPDAMLRLAASLAQASQHVISEAMVMEARARGLVLSPPTDVVETPGAGLSGQIDGVTVAIGRADYVHQTNGGARQDPLTSRPGSTTVTVSVGDRSGGALVFADTPRADAAHTLQALRNAGVEHIALVTGDHKAVADVLGQTLAFDKIYADVTPQGKVDAVKREAALAPTMMLGDGVNDAPALAAADVGVALGARGAAAASEAADVVVLVDRLDRLAEAITIASRTRSIARQSAIAGLALSMFGMIAAAAGFLTPLAGAILQELIDVAVVLNALRALHGAR